MAVQKGQFDQEIAASAMDRINVLSIEVAEIAGTIEAIRKFAAEQDLLVSHVRNLSSEVRNLASRVCAEGKVTCQMSTELAQRSAVSIAATSGVAAEIKSLGEAMHEVEVNASALDGSAERVRGLSSNVQAIAQQTRMASLKATIEAARAGQAGKKFAEVATEVKGLARQADTATLDLNSSAAHIENMVGELLSKTGESLALGDSANSAITVVNSALEEFNASVIAVDQKVANMSTAANSSLTCCEEVLSSVDKLGERVTVLGEKLREVDERVLGILERGEELMNLLATSGLETRDTPFIKLVTETARRISQVFEQGVDSKRISLGDLFDAEYIPMPGTNPQQYTARFTDFTDQVLPPIQEPQLDFSPLVVFCVAVDRNGYAPTHNHKYSLPQRSNPAWNNSNCRNRRMFNIGAGLRAAQNLKPFLLQTYRREMGGSKFTMMKDVSAPIFVKGKHWGALRLGYVLE